MLEKKKKYEFSARVRNLAKERIDELGVTRNQLSRLLGVTKVTLDRFLDGKADAGYFFDRLCLWLEQGDYFVEKKRKRKLAPHERILRGGVRRCKRRKPRIIEVTNVEKK